MANIAEILQYNYKRTLWSCKVLPVLADAYATLNWSDPTPKPTLAELQALVASTDAAIETDRLRKKQEALLKDSRVDALLWALENLCDALQEVAQKAQLKVGQNLDPAIVNRFQLLRTKIAEARAVS